MDKHKTQHFWQYFCLIILFNNIIELKIIYEATDYTFKI